MKLLGNKDTFAVEYRKTNEELGFARVWLGNSSIGTIEDEIFIKGYLIEGLNQIKNSCEIDIEIESKTCEEIFLELYGRLSNEVDQDIHSYLISLGTFCDDFTIFSFQKENEIFILWRLNNTDTPFSDLNSQNTNIKSFVIKNDKFSELLERYTETLLDHKMI